MSGVVRTIDLREDPDADLGEVVEHLRAGGLVAYPTETVYGLGGACTEEAVSRVRELKGRSDDKPLIALVPSADSVGRLTWTPAAHELVAIFWPGALTVVLADPEETFPPGVRDPRSGTVAVRVTPHRVASRLVEALGAPLTSTSLNDPGGPAVMSGADAKALLERWGAEDVWLLHGGTLPASGPSTVVDCTGNEPIVLRQGTVPIGRLRCAIPETHGTSSS